MIELKQVTKQYGKATVLKNITLSVDEPGIYCLLGRNGAGKTTLLKSIAGYQNITDGIIQVDGQAITTSVLDTGVSYIENFAKHFNLPVRKLLRIASEVNPNYDCDFALEMMERFELDGKKTFHHLSLGMKSYCQMMQTRLPKSYVFLSDFSSRERLIITKTVICWNGKSTLYNLWRNHYEENYFICIVSYIGQFPFVGLLE